MCQPHIIWGKNISFKEDVILWQRSLDLGCSCAPVLWCLHDSAHTISMADSLLMLSGMEHTVIMVLIASTGGVYKTSFNLLSCTSIQTHHTNAQWLWTLPLDLATPLSTILGLLWSSPQKNLTRVRSQLLSKSQKTQLRFVFTVVYGWPKTPGRDNQLVRGFLPYPIFYCQSFRSVGYNFCQLRMVHQERTRREISWACRRNKARHQARCRRRSFRLVHLAW